MTAEENYRERAVGKQEENRADSKDYCGENAAASKVCSYAQNTRLDDHCDEYKRINEDAVFNDGRVEFDFHNEGNKNCHRKCCDTCCNFIPRNRLIIGKECGKRPQVSNYVNDMPYKEADKARNEIGV